MTIQEAIKQCGAETPPRKIIGVHNNGDWEYATLCECGKQWLDEKDNFCAHCGIRRTKATSPTQAELVRHESTNAANEVGPQGCLAVVASSALES